MLSTLAIVSPLFALILTGWICRRIGVLGARASPELNRFVVYLALPALLFDVMAHARWSALPPAGFVAAFAIGCAVVFGLTVASALLRRRPLADASLDGLNAAYANTGFVGVPLCLTLFGKESLPAATIATILTACVLFAVAIVLIETGVRQGAENRGRMLLKVGLSLARNPLLVAPALGALVAASGLALPAALDAFVKLLGGAASPCALVALGLFLGERRVAETDVAGPGMGSVLRLVALKLLLHPGLTWLIAFPLLRLPAETGHVAVLLAALPTGTGPFMLAEFYRREATVTSRAILLSTIGSLLTVSAYLALARP